MLLSTHNICFGLEIRKLCLGKSDKMSHTATFYQSLHCLLIQNQFSVTKMHRYLDSLTYYMYPLKYKKGISDLIVFTYMEYTISIKNG